jgi:hypothetical protein
MIFSPTNNKTILSIYNIIWDVFIGFSSFIIFFGIFIKFFYNSYEELLLKTYIIDALSNYSKIISNIKTLNLILNLTNIINSDKTNAELDKDIATNDEIINSYNAYYDNLLLYVIGGVIGFFLLILLIPVLIGFISYKYINFKYIIINFILHLILIVAFETIIMLGLLPLNNPLHIYNFFNGAGV